MKTTFIILLVTVLIVVFAIVFFLKRLIKRAFSFPRVPNGKRPDDYNLSYREYFIPTAEKSRIQAWYVFDEKRMAPERPLIVGVHGWRESMGSLLPIAADLTKKGWRCLLINARNHGDSESVKYSTMVTFGEDVESAVDFALSTISPPVTEIVNIGHSIGAASSLYAASKDGAGIKGIVSISSFVDLEGNIRRGFINKLPSKITGIVIRFLEFEIGERLRNLTPENTIRKLSIPILLLHGDKDPYAKPQALKTLYENSRKEMVEAELIPGDHMSVLNAEKTHQLIDSFLTRRFTY